ncbi:MAG: peptidylprolyl isomerase [Pseudorhodobacter sp.]
MLKEITLRAAMVLTGTMGFAGLALAQDAAESPAPDAGAVAEAPAEATPPVIPEGGAEAVVAIVGGSEIKLGHMIAMRNNLPPQYLSLPDDVLFKGILDQLVQQAALAATVGDNLKIGDRLAMENDRRGYLSGLALADVVRNAVTEEALQAAYDEKFANAAPKTEYNAAHILVATEDEAKALKAEIDGGADFAELAKEHSTDGAAQNGGDLGWFSEGMMVAPFQEAVAKITAGTVSDPVETQFGWHLIQLKETRNAEAPSLDEVRDELAQEIEAKVVQDHINKVSEAADITTPGEGFDPALLRETELMDK